MPSISLRIALLSILCLWSWSSVAQEPFYKGKRLTFLINFAGGGPSDIEGRLLAKHLIKHIDGNPSLIIQNKDGAAGLIGTNYLGEVGPRDGTMAGFLTGAAWQYVMEPEHYRVDFKTFEFIGFQPGNAVYYVRSDLPPGIKEARDILKAQGLVVGGLSAVSSKDMLLRATLDMLGVPFKYVTGFRSSSTARLAVQRGEVHLHSESTPAYLAVVEPSMVKTGVVTALWYDPDLNGDTFSVPKSMAGSTVQPFPDFYRSVKGGLPSGNLWAAYKANLAISQAMLRTVVMPPNVPKAAADSLRTALARLNNDKDYAEESMKTMQFVPFYQTGPDINARVRKALSVSPEVRSFVLDYIKSGGK